MTLAETFDTHIKAISTAEEWEQYKAMTMNRVRFTEKGIETWNPDKEQWDPLTLKVPQRGSAIVTQNNKAMKYRVITDQFMNLVEGDVVNGDLHVDGQAVEKLAKFTNWFEPVEQVEGGQYWELCNEVYRVGEPHKNRKSWLQELKTGDNISILRKEVQKQGRKLSTHEIEQALIKEAKRRGFEGELDYSYKDGVRYTFDENDGNWQYNTEFDELTHSSSPYCIIYRKGSFAEKIDQTPHIEINGYEADFHEDYVQFGCAKIDKQVFINLNKIGKMKVGDNGNKFVESVTIGEGEFTTKEIETIAEYYE